MKIFTAKKKFNPAAFLISLSFFVVSGVVFFVYSVDFSSLMLAFIIYLYLKFFRRLEHIPSYLDLILLASIAIIVSFLITLVFKLSGYAIPVIGFAILVTLLFDNLELSLLFVLFMSTLSASLEGQDFEIGISFLCAGIAASIFSFRIRRRSQIIKAGLFAGLVQFAIIFILESIQGRSHFFSPDYLEILVTCVGSGILFSILVIGILPIFEFIFEVVTNISLLELSDFNHPLLRRMILEAPGTYQHSLIVANLAEAASDAIGANSLLARVGAYYHDIGKILKPQYFVENQIPYRDVHRDLKPSISKLIITNHVKDGVELAKKYRLNPRIIDFIQQHHGRSLVYYFYQRAKELEPEKKDIEEEYRYPGPKPQSKEVAIVALADTLEAVSRTLEDPTPSRIEELVKEVVRRKFLEGELDESELTLKDLDKITKAFIRILTAVFHARINYPKDENSDKKSAKNKENKSN